MSSTSKKILVTGAAGFIGFHFASHLARSGIPVVGLDNFNSYYDVTLKESRAIELKKMGVPVEKVDVSDSKELYSVLDKQNFSHIVHLAAQAGVQYSLKCPEA